MAKAMGHAACTTAHDIKASAIVAITTSGYTAEMMAKYKPVEPIIAATPDSKTYHQQALTRGVYPVLTQRSSNWNDLMEKAIEGAERMKFVKKGDWSYDALEKYTHLRYRLLPYIYSTSWEVTSKADVYEAYKGYKAFLREMK